MDEVVNNSEDTTIHATDKTDTSPQSDPVASTPETSPSQETAPQATEQTEDTQTEQPQEWFMKDKYKSVEEQARAAFELQKKMGKFWGNPKEDYKLDGIEGIKTDDPLLANLMPAIKDIGLSQEGFQHLVKQYQEANVQMMKKFEEELKHELTVKDAATYQAVDKWMVENLTPEERTQVQNNWLMSAADFKLFNQLRLMAAPSTSVPSSTDGTTVKYESSKEVENDKIKYRREVNQKIRVPDKNYEAELAQRFRDSRTRELRVK